MFLRKGLTGVINYVSKNHGKYMLMVHFIFVVKYRRNLLIKFGDEIKQIFYDIAKKKDIVIVEMEVAKFFWKEKTFWSDGYFSCSIGNVSKETIEKYIQNKKRVIILKNFNMIALFLCDAIYFTNLYLFQLQSDLIQCNFLH